MSTTKKTPLDYPIRLLIATPAYGGNVHLSYQTSLIKLLFRLQHAGVYYELFMPAFESLITRGRNAACAYFLGSPSKFTHMIFIDADIGYDPEAVLFLLASNKGVSGCPYPIKKWDFKGLAHKLEELGKPASELDDDTVRHMALQRYCVDLKDRHKECATIAKLPKIEKGLFRVEHIGTGFMLIQRHVLEALIAAGSVESFVNDCHSYNQYEGSKGNFWTFFDTMIHPESRRYLSEDYAFCHKAQKAGFDIWLAAQFRLTHFGGQMFDGDFTKTYRFIRPE